MDQVREKLYRPTRASLFASFFNATFIYILYIYIYIIYIYPGKTTFLNDTVKSHKCTYIRQYHSIRPYITVSKIPKFDPTKLPYWDIYVNENKASTIKVGGTMAGEFTAGLSGGQRKLLLFELIYQRTKSQMNLLLILDDG